MRTEWQIIKQEPWRFSYCSNELPFCLTFLWLILVSKEMVSDHIINMKQKHSFLNMSKKTHIFLFSRKLNQSCACKETLWKQQEWNAEQLSLKNHVKLSSLIMNTAGENNQKYFCTRGHGRRLIRNLSWWFLQNKLLSIKYAVSNTKTLSFTSALNFKQNISTLKVILQ